MRKITVPSDIKKHVARGRRTAIMKFMVLFLVAFVAVFLYCVEATNIPDPKIKIVSIILCVIIGIYVPYYFSGIQLYLKDKSYVGRIIEVDVKDVKISKTFRERKREAGDSIQYVMVEDDDKKLHTCEIYDDGRIYSSRARNYSLGDTVVHIYGCEYLRPMHHPDLEKPQVCVVCGFKSDPHAEKCFECGCSLDIKIEEK